MNWNFTLKGSVLKVTNPQRWAIQVILIQHLGPTDAELASFTPDWDYFDNVTVGFATIS